MILYCTLTTLVSCMRCWVVNCAHTGCSLPRSNVLDEATGCPSLQGVLPALATFPLAVTAIIRKPHEGQRAANLFSII